MKPHPKLPVWTAIGILMLGIAWVFAGCRVASAAASLVAQA